MALSSNPLFLPLALLLEDPAPPSGSSMLVPFVAILGVFYFLLIRPESKRRKEHEALIGNLGKGDTVLTNGGIVGTIVSVKENVISLQVSDGVRIKIVRSAIQGMVDPNTGLMPSSKASAAKAKTEDEGEGESS